MSKWGYFIRDNVWNPERSVLLQIVVWAVIVAVVTFVVWQSFFTESEALHYERGGACTSVWNSQGELVDELCRAPWQ